MKKFSKILGLDFSNGLEGWSTHSLDGDINIIDDPVNSGEKALSTHINYYKDYSELVTGVPRCEILSAGIPLDFFLEYETEYIIKFNTFLPEDLQIEEVVGANPMTFFQILSDKSFFGLIIDSNFYRVNNNGSFPNSRRLHDQYLLSINDDLGAWTEWVLHYKPSYDNGIIAVFKDRQFLTSILGTNCGKDETPYLKFGLYKWAWKTATTTTSDIEIYHSDIKVYKKV